VKNASLLIALHRWQVKCFAHGAFSPLYQPQIWDQGPFERHDVVKVSGFISSSEQFL